ncbi:hypothetical protein AB1Y20_023381 [Prymnesium parvum]|uniref:Protein DETOXIFICATION n=1 Tax=Prymnesium parvum TaxID=97485 RepID=A0AB34JGH2_PRYPA
MGHTRDARPARRPLFREALRILTAIIAPTAFGNALEYLPVASGLAIVGRQPLSDARLAQELDAMMLARAYFNLVAMAPGFGVITALRTLCPQAVGARREDALPIYLQRAFLLILAMSAPAIALLLLSERILLLAGQPAELARLARPYCVRLIPQYFGCVGMSAIQRVYQALGYNWANTLICLVVCAAAPALQWLFVVQLEQGYLGAAVASAWYNLAYLCLQLPHLAFLGRASLFRPHVEALRLAGLREFVALTLPGFLMVCAEWWVLELAVLASGWLTPPALTIGAFSIASTVQALTLMAWIGLAVAASVEVGTHIGAADVPAARRAAACVLALGVAMASACAGCLLAWRHSIARLFTSSAPINELTARLLPFTGLIAVLDATSNTLGGVCSGLGLQRFAAASQLLGYYVVGIPIGVVLAFVVLHGERDGVFGLCTGTAAAMLTSSALVTITLLRHDWGLAADAAERRLSSNALADETSLSRMRKSAKCVRQVSVAPEEDAANLEACQPDISTGCGQLSDTEPTKKSCNNQSHKRFHSSRKAFCIGQANVGDSMPLRLAEDLACS